MERVYSYPSWRFGVGVCGIAAQTMTSLHIDDVHQFDGQITCDASTNSEIVIPVQLKSVTIAVLDIDSNAFERSDSDDQLGLESIVRLFEKSLTARKQYVEKSQLK